MWKISALRIPLSLLCHLCAKNYQSWWKFDVRSSDENIFGDTYVNPGRSSQNVCSLVWVRTSELWRVRLTDSQQTYTSSLPAINSLPVRQSARQRREALWETSVQSTCLHTIMSCDDAAPAAAAAAVHVMDVCSLPSRLFIRPTPCRQHGGGTKSHGSGLRIIGR